MLRSISRTSSSINTGVNGGTVMAAIASRGLSSKRVVNTDVAIIGGGAGGLAVAGGLKLAGAPASVTVIEPAKTHYYQPLWTMVGGGVKTLQESGRPMAELISARGAAHVTSPAVEINTAANEVRTADGSTIKYKNLVVATGVELQPHKVKGLRESLGRNGVCSNYIYPYANYTAEAIRSFQGGRALFTLPFGPFKCPGAPQKIMYLAEDAWRQRGIRDKTHIQFNSAIGAIFGIPYYAGSLARHAESVGIKDINFGMDLQEIDADRRVATFKRVLVASNAPAGAAVGDIVKQDFNFIHVTPPQGPYQWLQSSGLTNAGGWMDVDPHTLRTLKASNVYAIGDISSVATSKTAVAAGAEARVVVKQLTAITRGDTNYVLRDEDKYDGYTACPIPTGRQRLILAEFSGTTGKIMESFPFIQNKRRTSMYWLKSEILAEVYWQRLLWGQTDVPQLRALSAPIRQYVQQLEAKFQCRDF